MSTLNPTPDRPLDQLGRPLRELRVSVTDRCNMRCGYCMPKSAFGPGHVFLPRAELLSFEEVQRAVRAFVGCGVRKVRLTGGEPLLRRDLDRLVELLAELPIDDLALTTNGTLLASRAEVLASAGLKRVTVSLDALDADVFRRVSDADVEVRDVLRGIEAALAAGLGPVKINCVVRRGVNEDQILPLARYFKGTGCTLRFIEFMDVGSTNRWRADQVVSAEQIVGRIESEFALQPMPGRPSDVARRYAYADGDGEVGVIASVTQPFCGGCQRARLSANGRLYTCLFATAGFDLRERLRSGDDDETLRAAIDSVWSARKDRYSEQRGQIRIPLPKVEMSYIGG